MQQQSVNVPIHQSMPQTTITSQPQQNMMPTKSIAHPQPMQQQPQQPPAPVKIEPVPVKIEDEIDVNWLYVCDWRGCQRYAIPITKYLFFFFFKFNEFHFGFIIQTKIPFSK